MAKALALTAIISLIVTLILTLIAVWRQLEAKDDLILLVEMLLSWKVITGGLITGAGVTFQSEIIGLINRISK